MDVQEPASDLLVANLTMRLHRFGYPGRLLGTAPRHGAIDAVEISNPVGLPLAKLRKVKLVLLK